MAKAQIEIEETAGTSGESRKDIAWLQALEEKVHAAAGRIRELREENAGLQQKIEELEERLDQLAAAPAPSGETAGWAEEREEIRGRVARLVEQGKVRWLGLSEAGARTFVLRPRTIPIGPERSGFAIDLLPPGFIYGARVAEILLVEAINVFGIDAGDEI